VERMSRAREKVKREVNSQYNAARSYRRNGAVQAGDFQMGIRWRRAEALHVKQPWRGHWRSILLGEPKEQTVRSDVGGNASWRGRHHRRAGLL
jgi:hypothetical protein